MWDAKVAEEECALSFHIFHQKCYWDSWKHILLRLEKTCSICLVIDWIVSSYDGSIWCLSIRKCRNDYWDGFLQRDNIRGFYFTKVRSEVSKFNLIFGNWSTNHNCIVFHEQIFFQQLMFTSKADMFTSLCNFSTYHIFEVLFWCSLRYNDSLRMFTMSYYALFSNVHQHMCHVPKFLDFIKFCEIFCKRLIDRRAETIMENWEFSLIAKV